MSEELLNLVVESSDGAVLSGASGDKVSLGQTVAQWLETARREGWGCDVILRSRREPGVWQEGTCHSSVLAAVSPVLRQCLGDAMVATDHSSDPVVIISELGLVEVMTLVYSGQVSVTSSKVAGEVWAAMAELGVGQVKRLGGPSSELTGPAALTSLVSITLCGSAAVETPVTHDSLVTMEQSEDTFTCEHCKATFMTEISLSTHVTDYHMEIKCRECQEILKGNDALIRHTVAKHPLYPDLDSGKSFEPTCEICKETFVNNQALKFHQYKHSGVKPYKCKICDAAFRTPSTLKSHLIQHEDCKHKCSVCGLKCSTSGKLKIHMRTHTNEKPFKCSFCPSMFKQMSVLKVHEFTHTKKSNHKCDRCGKFFPTKNRLVMHRSKPVCYTRNQRAQALRKQRKLSDPHQLHILDELYDNTIFVQSEKNLGGDYDQGLNYPGDSLDNLETSDIPVLVDNLPVIIHTDISNRALETDDEVEKHAASDEMMFNL